MHKKNSYKKRTLQTKRSVCIHKSKKKGKKAHINKMAALNEMLGNKVLNKYGEIVNIGAHCAGKVVGFYFSAHW